MNPFRHRPTGRVIGVNMKVLFSFCMAHPDLEPITGRACDYLLWRDPLERVVSLFADKCRQAVNPDKVQNVQSVILAAMGETSVAALRDLQFADLVGLLPSIYLEDRHMWPQGHRVELRRVGEVVEIARLPCLGRRLGIDFSVRRNQTSHGDALSYYTPATRAQVERLYAADYELRGHRSWRVKLRRLRGKPL